MWRRKILVDRGCVFLDRDGVINAKPPGETYVRRWEEFEWIPGIVDWIRLFNVLGYLVVVITNQRGVARGVLSRDAVETIHRNMVEHLLQWGARVDDVLYCPHDEYSCECRKPRPGLILQAQKKWAIDLSRSLLIGDSEPDRRLAEAVGIPFVLVDQGTIINVITDKNAS